MAAERIILKGRAETLKPIITEILALHQLIHDRDIGEFCGYPLDEYVRAKPQRFKLKIVFYSVQTPPWRSLDNSDLVRATYHVPFVQRSKIDWETIKTACGGATGYLWGRFFCNASVQDDDANIRKMHVYGATAAEAEQRLKAFLTLTDAQILTLNITEEQREGKRASDKKLYKEATRVYPAHFTIIHQEKIITESNIATLSGNYRRTKFRIPLWTSTKPDDADEKIIEALRIRGSSTSP